MSNSQTISFFLSWPQLKEFQCDIWMLINNLDCISSRLYRRSPLPFPLLPFLYETMKSFMWNWAIGKESSSFVSDIRSTSILLSIVYISGSDLFLTELILRWSNISLSGDWILIFLSPFFASLISFSASDLWKTVSSEIIISTPVFIPLCFRLFWKETSKFIS